MKLAVVLAAMLLASCNGMPKIWESSPRDNFVVDVSVDSISGPDAVAKRTYFIAPADEKIPESDLLFQEFALYVDRALAENGFTKAAARDSASIVVLLHYGIGDPQTLVLTRNVPIFGQTGVSSSTTTGMVSPNYGGGASYSATTRNTPTYGITGVVQKTTTETYFNRFILVSAYDWQSFLKDKEQTQVWRTTITSAGTSSDMRQVFPVMVGGALNQLGKNSGQRVSAKIGDLNPAVLIVKGQAPPAP